METQTEPDTRARIAEIRQRFERLSRNCNSFIRISPETIKAYKDELKQLEAKLI